MNSTGLKDKVVIVSGGGRGIGREIALLLGRLGAKVLVNDLGSSLDGTGASGGPAENVASEVRQAGGIAMSNGADISDYDAVCATIQRVVDEFGRIDGIINTAGMLRDKIFHKMEVADWTSVLSVHLTGSFNLARAAAPVFRANGSGSLVFFTSTSGLVGAVGQANYSAAKMGIVGLSRSIALDMQRFSVRSNCVAPFAWGRMLESIPTDTDEQKKLVEQLRGMTAEKIAPFCAFLMSDAAADVSGQIFGARGNEIFVMSQPRVTRSIAMPNGWTVEAIEALALPSLRAGFTKLETSGDYFDWAPV